MVLAGTSERTKSGNAGEFSADDVYKVLSYRRRRYAVHHLKQIDEPVSVGDLAEQVSAWENSKPIKDLNSQERKRVYVSLYQSHLPTLAEMGIIEYNDERGIVELADGVKNIDVYIEVVPDRNIPWSVFHFGLAAAFSIILLFIRTGVSVFDQISILWVSVFAAAAYGIAAIAQALQQRRAKLGDEGPPPEVQEL